MRAFDAETGTEVFQRRLSHPSVVAEVENLIGAGTFDGELVVWDTQSIVGDCAVVWQRSNLGLVSAMVAAAGVLYVGAAGIVLAWSADARQELWCSVMFEFGVFNAISSLVCVRRAAVLCAITYTGMVGAWHVRSGAELWRKSLSPELAVSVSDRWHFHGQLVENDEIIYAQVGKRLLAWRSASGSEIWQKTLQHQVCCVLHCTSTLSICE